SRTSQRIRFRSRSRGQVPETFTLHLNCRARVPITRRIRRSAQGSRHMSSMTNPYAPPKAAVRDIYTSDSSIVYADRGTRLAAALLAGIIFAAMVYLPMVLMVAGGAAVDHGNPEAGGMSLLFMVGGVLTLAGFVAWCWLTILYVHRNGQTIAKKMLNIK